MSIAAMLDAIPAGLLVDTQLGEITIKTAMTNGPAKPWQDRLGGISLVVFLAVNCVGGLCSWLMPPEMLSQLTGPLCSSFLLSVTGLGLSMWGRSGGPLLLRGNTLVATRRSIQLDQITSVQATSAPISRSTRHRHGLRLVVDGAVLTWDMPRVSAHEADWICLLVEAAALEARSSAGTAAEIPAALRGVQAHQESRT